MKKLSLSLVLLCMLVQLFATTDPDKPVARQYFTQKVTGKLPVIDGEIEDEAWNAVPWSTDYVQREPEFGAAPTEQTAFRILYDDEYLYVAFRCYDSEPDKVVKRMSRRDGFAGDWVELNIDSYFDKRTAFSFSVSAAGVKGDEFISNDGNNWDSNWNPIWFAKAAMDAQGWTAEMKIPLSQLRYSDKEDQVWGIQSTRRFFRAEERSTWQTVEQNAGAWVSRFGELHGLKGLKSQKQIEIQPYVVAQTSTFEKEEGNPFATGSDSKITGGVDGKIGITSDLVLDFTINPDFGQVEADPSQVALDGFQVFFSERRPFFIENRNIFDFRAAPNSAANMFYSRRIGRSPSHYPDLEDGEYADVPSNTSILGAAKFSGKTQKGLSIGILETVTAKEVAEIDFEGSRREEVVEPLTNYFVGRLQQDYRDGNTTIGGIFTATNRSLEDTGLDWLHKSAYTGGLDVFHRWGKERWYTSGQFMFSNVQGTTEAITRTQESIGHLFDRVGATHVSVDTTATSLIGNSGILRLGKAGGHWRGETSVNWHTPGFEINDVGFLRNADEIKHSYWTQYSFNRQFSIFRNMRFNYSHTTRWDFSGQHLYLWTGMNAHANLKNFWNFGMGYNREHKDLSNFALRGGPTLRQDKSNFMWAYIETNARKKVRFNFNGTYGKAQNDAVKFWDFAVQMTVQPMDALNFSIRPSIASLNRRVQYVSDVETDKGETKYIVANIDQRTLRMTIRANYNITPDFTIQYYGQPFISRGRYSDFKEITDPLAKHIDNRYERLTGVTFDEENEEYLVDRDLDQTTDFSFSDPDFNFIQFRSNLVARWEYVPGSELFLVWTQDATANADPMLGLNESLNDNLFSEKARNIFVLKWTYRFLL